MEADITTHHSPPGFLAHAKGRGSNPKLCILAPVATLQPQPNFQLLELHGQGRAELGTLPLVFNFFPAFGLFLFHLLQFSSFLMPFFLPGTRASFLTDKGCHPGQNSTQKARSFFIVENF